jgi:Tfp pilus assembly protein PilF
MASHRAIVIGLVLASAGCATSGAQSPRITERWIDEARSGGLRLEDPLAISPELRTRVKEHLTYEGTEKARMLRLVRYLADSDGLAFHYHPQQSLTAERAFFARQGDCMSYANLYVALARMMDVGVRFVRITQLPVTWESRGRFFESSHMAVAFGREAAWDQSLIVDFGNTHSAPWRFALYDDVSDELAFVLFQNNVAVEKMIGGEVGEAERILRFLLARSPEVPEVHNNLGLVLMQAGRLNEALAVLEAGVEHFPRFRPLYANAVQAARRLGDDKLAESLQRRGHELLEDDPSWNFNEGMRSYHDRAFLEAAVRFEKALSVDPDNLHLLAWTARAHLAAGQLRQGLEEVERIRSRPSSETQDVLLRDLQREFPEITPTGAAKGGVGKPVAAAR